MISLIVPIAVQNYFFSYYWNVLTPFVALPELVSIMLGMLPTQYSFNENYTNDIPEYTYKTKPVVDNLSLNRLNPLNPCVRELRQVTQ